MYATVKVALHGGCVHHSQLSRSAECSSRGMTCTSLRVSIGKVPTQKKKYFMVWNISGVVQVKIVVKVRGQHIANRTYTGAQTNKAKELGGLWIL